MHKEVYQIGVICTPKGNATEKFLFPLIKKKFDVVFFPLHNDIDYDDLKKKSESLRVVLNTAGDIPYAFDALEMIKTFEGFGKHVIDSSKSFYYREDKWLFYQTCLKHHLPTPKSYYIPRNINLLRGKLRNILKEGPVVFKGIFSDTGRDVKRASTYSEALRAVSILRKHIGTMPIVAQKYIEHGTISYRVTLVGDHIVQAITKYGKTWKEGKLFWKNEKYRLFIPDKFVTELCKKTARIFGLEWCGIDLMKDSEGQWYLIEVNSCPSMDFIIRDAKRASEELVDYLLNVHKKTI
ncbi:MAG: hypothetical protein AABX08_03710 [Nanoarchaeota archaeon]